jgi:hypothetical protein
MGQKYEVLCLIEPPCFPTMTEAETTTVATCATSRSSIVARERLPKHVLKQLLQDLEANGGIQAYVGSNSGQRLYHLLEARVEQSNNPYGNRGDPIRRKIRRSVAYLFSMKKNKYEEKLAKLNILPHAERKKKGQLVTPPPRVNRRPTPSKLQNAVHEEFSVSGSSSSSSLESACITSPPRKTPRRQIRATLASQNPPSSEVAVRTVQSPSSPVDPVDTIATALGRVKLATMTSKKNIPMSDVDIYHFETPQSTPVPAVPPRTQVVFANTRCPSMNREVTKIYSSMNIEGIDGKTWYFGFTVVLKIQAQYILDIVGDDDQEDPYRLRQYTTNTLLLTLPATDYNFRNVRDQIADATSDDPLIDALDEELHWEQERIDNGSEPLAMKNILIVFPENVNLVSKEVVNQSLVSNENEYPALSLVLRETHRRSTGAQHAHYVYWKVGRNDVTPNKKGKVQKKKKNRLAEEFGFEESRPRQQDDVVPDQVGS